MEIKWYYYIHLLKFIQSSWAAVTNPTDFIKNANKSEKKHHQLQFKLF